MSWRPTCPSVPTDRASFLHRLTRFPSAPFQVRQDAVSGRLSVGGRRRSRPHRPGFPSPFGHRHSLLEPSRARWGVGPSSRSAYHGGPWTPSGLSRCAWVRHDRVGRPLNPADGGVVPAGAPLHPAPAASQRPSVNPATTTHRRDSSSRGINKGSRRSSLRSSPHPWLPDGTGALWLDHLSSAPRSYPRRTSGWGQASTRAWNYTFGISRTSSMSLTPSHAPSCRKVLRWCSDVC